MYFSLFNFVKSGSEFAMSLLQAFKIDCFMGKKFPFFLLRDIFYNQKNIYEKSSTFSILTSI